ncbi:MAG TPA: hypothetical protein VHX43_03395 [Xanthobacteraceae bacterium]|nr:hypothetical protein [Xanthobacteraceae bacterium]
MKPKLAGLYVPVLILSVIIDPEYNAITEVLPRIGAKRCARTSADEILEIDRWLVTGELGKTLEVATAFINGMGNARSAMESFIYLERINPRYVFLCGISGTLCPEAVGLGDVVVAKSVQWWNLNKLTKDSAKAAADGSSKYLRLGEHYFRKEISVVGRQSTHWNKRLAYFASGNKNRLLSNTDGTMVNMAGRSRSRLPTVLFEALL